MSTWTVHPACTTCPLSRALSRLRPPHCAATGCFLVTHHRAKFCPHPDGPRFGVGAPPATWGQKAPALSAEEMAAYSAQRQRALWRQLHGTALALSDDPAAFARYVRGSFTPRVTCGPCAVKWLAILERMPPEQAADRGGPFAWSVDVHDEVNAELGKPRLGQEAARRLYTTKSEGAEGDDRRACEARSIDR